MAVEGFLQLRMADTGTFELVQGRLVALPRPTIKECMIRDTIGDALRQYFGAHGGGMAVTAINCRIFEDTVRRPDISLFRQDRLPGFLRDGWQQTPVPFVPDIAIEVLSSNKTAAAVDRKVKEYLTSGCQEVWLVDALNQEITIQLQAKLIPIIETLEYRSTAGLSFLIRVLDRNATLESPLLPGFSASVHNLIA